MDFRVLGPLEVRSDHGPVELKGPKPRAVLAYLLGVASGQIDPAREPVQHGRIEIVEAGERLSGEGGQRP